MHRNAARWLALLVASLVTISCAHSAPVLVGPDPCEALTMDQIVDLQEMIRADAYPGVEEIVSAFDQHCREDDCLMGRGDPAWCE